MLRQQLFHQRLRTMTSTSLRFRWLTPSGLARMSQAPVRFLTMMLAGLISSLMELTTLPVGRISRPSPLRTALSILYLKVPSQMMKITLNSSSAKLSTLISTETSSHSAMIRCSMPSPPTNSRLSVTRETTLRLISPKVNHTTGEISKQVSPPSLLSSLKRPLISSKRPKRMKRTAVVKSTQPVTKKTVPRQPLLTPLSSSLPSPLFASESYPCEMPSLIALDTHS